MDSPVRKQLKRNDYLRHKMFRKIKRRRKAEKELAMNAPAKELRRRLRRRTFKCGKDAYSGGKDEELIELPEVRVDTEGNVIADDGRKGTIRLPDTIVNTRDPRKYTTAFVGNQLYLDDITGFVPIAGDVNDAINAGIAVNNGDYSQAALLAGGLFLPNMLERPLRMLYKPVRRFLNGSEIIDRAVGAMSDLNFAKGWDDDVYTRWLLNGQNTPDFNIVYHGRKTYRGKPGEALRTYSDRDVGLHVTENKKTAKRFAGDDGVVYRAIDTGTYPDAIYPDLGEWDAQVWKHSLDKAQQITPEIEQEALKAFDPRVVDRDYGRYKAVRDILIDHNIDPEDISRMSRLSFFSRTDTEKLAANKEFANFLKERGVNFKYKNDFEGGGYTKPSIFITDESDLHWIPEIQMKEARKDVVPVLDFSTGTMVPGVETFPRYVEYRSNYASGKDSGIHIKPENRGKFTRLKKRTGKSASWFKAHGTPAQKKMAVFALNSRKWSHKK